MPASVVHRSDHVAGRLAPGAAVSSQQRQLIIQLGITREGEVITDETLETYLHFFDKPASQEKLTSCLALFGWTPATLPLASAGDVDIVV